MNKLKEKYSPHINNIKPNAHPQKINN